MGWADIAEAASTVGPVGVWAVVGLGLFRYLLTRQDKLARENLNELRRQLVDWRRRALRAELLVRAYRAEGHPTPTEQVRREAMLQHALEGTDVWPEYGAEEAQSD